MALAEISPAANDPEGRLLPAIPDLRAVARHVAAAVAQQAVRDGVAPRLSARAIERKIDRTIWEPDYLPYRRIRRSRPHTSGHRFHLGH